MLQGAGVTVTANTFRAPTMCQALFQVLYIYQLTNLTATQSSKY